MDDHMPAEPETRRASWLVYAATFAVALPVKYVVSSGPMQILAPAPYAYSNTGGGFGGGMASVGFGGRMGAVVGFGGGMGPVGRWDTPVCIVYAPLERLAETEWVGETLTDYWDWWNQRFGSSVKRRFVKSAH